MVKCATAAPPAARQRRVALGKVPHPTRRVRGGVRVPGDGRRRGGGVRGSTGDGTGAFVPALVPIPVPEGVVLRKVAARRFRRRGVPDDAGYPAAAASRAASGRNARISAASTRSSANATRASMTCGFMRRHSL